MDMFGGLSSALFRQNPYPFYEQLRSMGRAVWMPGILGRGAWLVTGHAECSAVLKENRFGKEAEKVLGPEARDRFAVLGQGGFSTAKTMLFRDPPDHTRLRGLVNQAFTPRMLERLRPHIQAIAEDLTDNLSASGEADLINDYAFPLPIIVIAEMLGVPHSAQDEFKEWSNALVATLDPTATQEAVAAAQEAITHFDEYFSGVIAERRKEPKDDLISLMIQARDEGDKLSEAELLATCRLLLAAGHETTVNLIGNGSLALLKHPEQQELLVSRPDLIVNAVEELLRYDSPVQLTARVAFEDLPIGDQRVKRGDQVLTILGGANRDPEHFERPEALDLTRQNANTHLAFAVGIHFCIGAPLARMEGQIALSTLLKRFPNVRLATDEELEYRGNITLRGLKALPVKL